MPRLVYSLIVILTGLTLASPLKAQDAAPNAAPVQETAPAQTQGETAAPTVAPAVAPAAMPAQDYSAYTAKPVHGVAMHGAPKYQAGFPHFDYVDPSAPKGGTLRVHAVGTFDNLNPFILKGVPASSIGLVFETLTQHAQDEAFTEYGLLAETIEIPEDRSWVAYNLRPQAKWADGMPVTADDVVWTFKTLIDKGAPFYKAYYANVKDVVAVTPQRVLFLFDGSVNLELPLIVGQLPVLPRHYWADKNFEDTTLTPPLGSGPYRVGRVEPGRFVEYVKVADWWGKDLPINVGRYNFDRITVDYYRDTTVALEGLFAGEYDFRLENTAKTWATGYENDLVKSGKIAKEKIKNEEPAGMQGFYMNTRRPVFQDRAVRQAVNLAFDFEWANRQFAFGAYTRTDSFFENSELASFGVPSGRELEILSAFKDNLPPEIFSVPFTVPYTDGKGNNRQNLKRASDILDAAGYKIGPDGIRLDPKTGAKLEFEIIESSPAFERWTLPMIQNLEKIGIKASFRVIDTAQYVNRIQNFDFDMTVSTIGQSLSPGNEQREFWHSSKAEVPGSRNIVGIKDPVVDALVDMVITAPSREELVYRTRALDRVLLWGYYVIPQWHLNAWRIAYWDKFGKPAITAGQDLGVVDTWWAKAPQ